MENQNMSSSSEEALEELLRLWVISEPRNFGQRKLFDIENPREFQGKFLLLMDTFLSLLEFQIGLQIYQDSNQNHSSY